MKSGIRTAADKNPMVLIYHSIFDTKKSEVPDQLLTAVKLKTDMQLPTLPLGLVA